MCPAFLTDFLTLIFDMEVLTPFRIDFCRLGRSPTLSFPLRMTFFQAWLIHWSLLLPLPDRLPLHPATLYTHVRLSLALISLQWLVSWFPPLRPYYLNNWFPAGQVPALCFSSPEVSWPFVLLLPSIASISMKIHVGIQLGRTSNLRYILRRIDYFHNSDSSFVSGVADCGLCLFLCSFLRTQHSQIFMYVLSVAALVLNGRVERWWMRTLWTKYFFSSPLRGKLADLCSTWM